MNISHFCFILFNLKFFGEIVTTYMKTYEDVNCDVAALDQIWLVSTEAGRCMISLCYAILGFRNFALMPSTAVKVLYNDCISTV